MANWTDFAHAAPELAARVQRLFSAHRHHTMATIRQDGGPRISGTEVAFEDGDLCIGMMAGAPRAQDLRRDPRIALHSQGVDPSGGDPNSWSGEAKIAGLGVETGDTRRADATHRFRIEITEVVLTSMGRPPDHLVIESWHTARGLTRHERR
jgi:hypothetical protein